MCSRGTRTDHWTKASVTDPFWVAPIPHCPNQKKYGIGGRAKKLNRVGHTRIYAWGVVPKSACLIGVVELDTKL
jgi:hypothetical protein